MGRVYSATFDNVSVSVDQDLFEINPASGKPVRLLAVFLGQNSDATDANDEQLRIRIVRGATAAGSGGSPVTPVKSDPNDVAFSGTVARNNTTEASGGSPETVHAECFNIRGGWAYVPPPEMRPKVEGGSRIVVNLPEAPSDALTMSGTVYFEEV